MHVNGEWFWLMKLTGKVMRLQKNWLSLNSSWSVDCHYGKIVLTKQIFQNLLVTTHLIRNFMLISNHISTIDKNDIVRWYIQLQQLFVVFICYFSILWETTYDSCHIHIAIFKNIRVHTYLTYCSCSIFRLF